MTDNSAIFADLRQILAELYPDESSTRRIVADANLNATFIQFNSRAIDVWHAILVEATKTNNIHPLIDVVRREYATNETLLNVWTEYHTLLDYGVDPLTDDRLPGEPPYKGMQYFDIDDAHLFFGREKLTANLIEHIQEYQFLAVIGASGSGKSSLVRAGLLSAMKNGKTLAHERPHLGQSPHWLVRIMTPTAHPLKVLATTLTSDFSVQESLTLMDALVKDYRSLDLAVYRALTNSRSNQFLLIVDQFEELFTLCRSENERQAFVNNLLNAAVLSGDGPLHVIITLRADFYAHCSHFAQLRDALATRQVYIGPMNSDELRNAIEEPAYRNGWEFEPGLVDLLLKEVSNESGALPLLAHVLLETWNRRRGKRMTLEGYNESGGINGAIAKTADRIYQQLTQEQQIIARNIFLRLTELGEGTQDTRRRVLLDELFLNSDNKPIVENVLTNLATARLITTYQREVEVAHEALIREWPTLRQWLDDNREGLRVHRHLTEAAQEWVTLQRDSGEVYRGPRLTQALLWAETHSDDLNVIEREFLEASHGLQQKEEAERIAQQQRNLEQAQALATAEAKRAEVQTQAARQLQRRAIFLAGALVVTVVLALVAFLFGQQASQNAATARAERSRADQQRDVALAAEDTAKAEKNRADQERDSAISAQATAVAEKDRADQQAEIARGEKIRADQEADLALSRQLVQLAAQSLNNLDNKGLAVLLGLQANRVVSDTYEAKSSLLTALQSSPRLVKLLNGHSDIVYKVALNPLGNMAISGSQDGSIVFWDMATYQAIETVQTDHLSWVTNVAFSPNGKLIASASAEIILWDVESRRPIGHPFTNHTELIWGLAFHPNGKILATGSSDQTIMLWNIENPENPQPIGSPLFEHTGEVRSLAFSPRDEVLAT